MTDRKGAKQLKGGGKVLDMGCGKGGDLNKWQKAKVKEYFGLGESMSLPFFHSSSYLLHPPRRRRYLN